MQTNGNGVLDLNALYGVEKPLKVLWKDKEFFLRRPQAFGPRDIVVLEGLQARAAGLQNLGEKMSDAQAVELESVLDKLLERICPDMIEFDIPFAARANIVMWYFKRVMPERADALEKKMTASQ